MKNRKLQRVLTWLLTLTMILGTFGETGFICGFFQFLSRGRVTALSAEGFRHLDEIRLAVECGI